MVLSPLSPSLLTFFLVFHLVEIKRGGEIEKKSRRHETAAFSADGKIKLLFPV